MYVFGDFAIAFAYFGCCYPHCCLFFSSCKMDLSIFLRSHKFFDFFIAYTTFPSSISEITITEYAGCSFIKSASTTDC